MHDTYKMSFNLDNLTKKKDVKTKVLTISLHLPHILILYLR